MKKHVSAFTLMALALLATPAFAQDHAGHGSHANHGAQAPAAKKTGAANSGNASFESLDKNRDGFVSKAELPERHPLLAHFGMSDKNGDGKLDRKEFADAMAML
ncbi:hypothetical protein LAG73_07970 [Pseudoxanthomonas japonensis]|nr:hypothetical protein LAG73_07970 [Pseudoxanthomonas japonensis]